MRVALNSRLTSKGQTTIPVAVRKALGVREGDDIVFVVEGDHVRLTRAEPEDPVIGAWLDFLERDMVARPHVLKPIPMAELDALLGDMDIDLDAPIDDQP
jgi:antitoxin PrlF